MRSDRDVSKPAGWGKSGSFGVCDALSEGVHIVA
jgi:hypothetical protein